MFSAVETAIHNYFDAICRMTSLQPSMLIYSDALPLERQGGFAALLDNLSYELSVRHIHLITCSSLWSSYNKKHSIRISWLPFVSHRLSSMPICFRLPLLFWDSLIALVLVHFFPRANPEAKLVVFIGTDLLGFFRGIACSFICKPKTVSAYIVDNSLAKYLSTSIPKRAKPLLFLLKAILSFYDNIYFVTDSLRVSYVSALDLRPSKTKTVSLPYSFNCDSKIGSESCVKPVLVKDKVLNFAFTGLLNPLTIACLNDIFRWIESHQCPCNFYLISSNYDQNKLILGNSSCIILKHLPIGCDLIPSAIPVQTVFICPHYLPKSFNASKFMKSLVTDSFPSKMLKMISMNYPVMLLANNESGVARSHSKYVFRLNPTCLASLSPREAYLFSFTSLNDNNKAELTKIHSILNLFSTPS